jgi:hypothetical protein
VACIYARARYCVCVCVSLGWIETGGLGVQSAGLLARGGVEGEGRERGAWAVLCSLVCPVCCLCPFRYGKQTQECVCVRCKGAVDSKVWRSLIQKRSRGWLVQAYIYISTYVFCTSRVCRLSSIQCLSDAKKALYCSISGVFVDPTNTLVSPTKVIHYWANSMD